MDVPETDQANIQPAELDQAERAKDGVVDPAIVVAEGATPKPCEQHGGRSPLPMSLDRSEQRRLIGSLKHQACERLPSRRRYSRVRDRQGGTEGLRNLGSVWTRRIGDIHIVMQPNRQPASESVHAVGGDLTQQLACVFQPIVDGISG